MAKITEKSLKILWGTSGNRCAFPDCDIEITAIPQGAGYTLGEMAHIKGDKPGSCRYDSSQKDLERHSHNNLILLCPTHHTIIDKPENLNTYTVDVLMEMKENHVQHVKDKLKVDPISNLEDLKQKISAYLTDNHTYWSNYGPISERAKRHPHSISLYNLWLQIRLEKIVPNNRAIFQLLKVNRSLFANEHQLTISNFMTHVESYESWVLSDDTYESVLPFPETFQQLILG